MSSMLLIYNALDFNWKDQFEKVYTYALKDSTLTNVQM